MNEDAVIGPFWMRVYAAEGQRFEQSFEGLSRFLDSIPGVQVELDGSWFWVSREPGNDWQIDGMIYDRLDAIEYVEIKGTCPYSALQIVFGAMASTESNVASPFQQYGDEANLDEMVRVHRVDLNRWITPSELRAS